VDGPGRDYLQLNCKDTTLAHVGFEKDWLYAARVLLRAWGLRPFLADVLHQSVEESQPLEIRLALCALESSLRPC
jgi:hypothetical protein